MNREVMPTGSNSQTTAYVYGTTSTSGVFSNDLLAKTEYPDPSTGLASTSAANDETYTYNALGQKTSYTDRNGTTHVYDDDVLGRLISDVIPSGDLGAGVSNQTLALGYSYNNAGLPFQQTSYSDSAMTTVSNQVEDLYSGYGQLITQYQAVSGSVSIGSTPSVQYGYSQPSATNYSRLVSLTYPNGRVEDYGYNTGIDATISRISTIADAAGTDAGTVAAYTYLGLSTIVQEAEPQINTELTYISQSGDTHALTDGGDRYTGLDRFGRVDDQWYLNTITTANLNSTTGVPNQNSWNLDALGNWNSGAGVSNSFNSQNEETGNGSNTLTYDNAGNMTTDQAGNLFTYDAWGHVVRIASPSNSTEETFSYDALGRAVVNNNGSGLENRYYSGTNIIQEQFSSTDYAQYVYGLSYVNDVILRDRNADGNNSTGNLGITGSGLEEREYAQHDTQFSTISLTDSTGSVMQRFIYDPYGTITVLTPSWAYDTSGGGTNYWLYTFQGMRIVDAPGTSGMLFSETRIYDAGLGRWISQDPAGYADATNLYQLEHAAPADFLDSSSLGLFTPGPGPGFGGPPIGDPYWSQRPLLGGQTPGAAYLYGRPNKTEGTGPIHITTTALAFHVCGCKAGSAQALADSLRDSLYNDLSTFKSFNAGNNTVVNLSDPEYPAFTMLGASGYSSWAIDDRPFHVWFQKDPATFMNTAYTLPGHPLAAVRKWWVEEAPDPTSPGCVIVYVLTQAFDQPRGFLNDLGSKYLGGLGAQMATWDTYFGNLGSAYGSSPGVSGWGQSPTTGRYAYGPNPWWPY